MSNLSAAEAAKGFKDANNGLAWRFTTKDPDSPGCGYHDSCVTLELLAYANCRSVYVEGNVLDDSGKIVGMTNDTVSQMLIGDVAEVVLPILEEQGAKVRLTQINCH